MAGSGSAVRALCWTLIAAAVVAGVVRLLFVFGILWPQVPDNPDTVEFILSLRAEDARAFPFSMVGGVASLLVFTVAATLGVVLRRWSLPGAGRDGMTALLMVGGAVGVMAQLVYVGTFEVATFGYCDCVLKAESVISQDWVLKLGETVVEWLVLGGITLTGVGLALAGRVVDVSAGWRTLSTVIAIGLFLAAFVQIFRTFVFIDLQLEISDLILGLVAGALVPIWAFMLARGLGPETATATSEATSA